MIHNRAVTTAPLGLTETDTDRIIRKSEVVREDRHRRALRGPHDDLRQYSTDWLKERRDEDSPHRGAIRDELDRRHTEIVSQESRQADVRIREAAMLTVLFLSGVYGVFPPVSATTAALFRQRVHVDTQDRDRGAFAETDYQAALGKERDRWLDELEESS